MFQSLIMVFVLYEISTHFKEDYLVKALWDKIQASVSLSQFLTGVLLPMYITLNLIHKGQPLLLPLVAVMVVPCGYLNDPDCRTAQIQ